jgi:hypothetical protein
MASIKLLRKIQVSSFFLNFLQHNLRAIYTGIFALKIIPSVCLSVSNVNQNYFRRMFPRFFSNSINLIHIRFYINLEENLWEAKVARRFEERIKLISRNK